MCSLRFLIHFAKLFSGKIDKFCSKHICGLFASVPVIPQSGCLIWTLSYLKTLAANTEFSFALFFFPLNIVMFTLPH